MAVATTAQELIRLALQDLGALGARQPLHADDADTGLTVLNFWLDGLTTHRAALYALDRHQFNLSANTASYTMGPGGAFDVPRPAFIESKAIVLDRTATPVTESHRGPVLTPQAWQSIPQKSLTASTPVTCYPDFDVEGAGLMRVYVYPVPTSSVAALVLYVPVALSQFTDLTTTVYLPNGAARAIQKQLAVELAPSFQVDPPTSLVEAAVKAMGDFKRQGAARRVKELGMPAGLSERCGGYNIYTDEP